MFPDESSIMAVSVRVAPEARFEVVVDRTTCVAAPELRTTLAGELVAVQDCHTAVTVVLSLPAAIPLSVQLVWVDGLADVGQFPPAIEPLRVK
jgi:hypothetical protein